MKAFLCTLCLLLPFPIHATNLPEYPVPAMNEFIPTTYPVDTALFSPDGRVLWATNGQQLKAFDTRSGRLLADEGVSGGFVEFSNSTNFKVLFNGAIGSDVLKRLTSISPDGRYIGLVARQPHEVARGITVWSIAESAMLWDTVDRRMLHAGTGLGDIYGFSPDGRWMIVKGIGKLETRDKIHYRTGPVEVRDLLTNAVVKTLAPEGVAQVAADGSQLVIINGEKRLLFTFPYDKKGRKLAVKDGIPFEGFAPRKPIADTTLTAEFRPGREASLRVVDNTDGKVIAEHPLVASFSRYQELLAGIGSSARQQQAQAAAAQAAELAARIAARPADYQAFLVNFEPMPLDWTLDYATLRGRDITAQAWSRHWGPFFGGETFNALGKIADCQDGGVALLALTRSLRNGADVASFQLLVLDVDGKPRTTVALGQTQKDASGRPLAFNMSITGTATDATLLLHQARWDGDQHSKRALDKRICAVY